MTVSNPSISSAAGTADRELIITRVFDAPRELVWQAWTDPAHIVHWWGPNGFTTTIEKMDLRPGGVWNLIMHGPDGKDYPNHSIFLEVVEPERVVYQLSGGRKGDPSVQFESTWTFAEEGSQTRVTIRMLFNTPQELDLVVKTHGAIEGGHQTLGRLAEYLPQIAAGRKELTDRELVITRIFDAPREAVFKAWTEPERLRLWWGPRNFTNPVCELDLRPGGSIRIDMRAPNGTIYPMAGVFQEIVQPERIVFTSWALDKNSNPLFEVLNTVTFSEHDGKTELTLRARVTNATIEAAPYLAGMEQGWSQSLDRLADRCGVPDGATIGD